MNGLSISFRQTVQDSEGRRKLGAPYCRGLEMKLFNRAFRVYDGWNSQILSSGIDSMPKFLFVPSSLRISALKSGALLTILALLCLSGCGGGGNSGGGGSNPIGVSVAASSTTVNGNATVKLTAT